MQATWQCPICGDKLRGLKQYNKYSNYTKRVANYSERTCTGLNHCLQILVDTDTKQVDFLKISLNPNYSRYIYIDYYNQKCKIIYYKDGKEEYIEVPRMIEPDFPDLLNLKEKTQTLSLFF